MTDNEIIEALECCKIGNCDDCPFYGIKEDCEVELPEEGLDLINRQKEEIERLQRKVLMLYPKGSPCSMQVEVSDKLEREIKSEAIKEFAERLKSEYEDEKQGRYIDWLMSDIIDNLVKEMTEAV